MRRRTTQTERVLRSSMNPTGGGGRTSLVAPLSTELVKVETVPSGGPFSVVFHHPDALAVATSDELPVPVSGHLPLLIARLTTPSSLGDVEMDVLVNGAIVDTLTVAAGSTDGYVEFAAPVAFNGTPGSPDVIALDLTSIGTGAAGLVVTGTVG